MLGNLQKHIKKSMAKKHLGGALIGEIVLKSMTDFFVKNGNQYGTMDGFVKFSTVFIRTKNQGLKIAIFRQEKMILQYVNTRLEAAGYEKKITKILFKGTISDPGEYY